ncbi:hypothetical protein DFH09DRAFT_1115019 [Mycena vulgaris]|nr:hypothetical protein DFH09DRAFT_1115019 [Mycena vulgaris]
MLPETPNGGADSLQKNFFMWKQGLQLFGQRRAKESIGALEQKKVKLQKECDTVLNEVDPPGNDDSDGLEFQRAEKAADLQKDIVKINAVQRDKRRVRTKVRFCTETDSITKFSVRMSKDTKPRDTMYVLRRTDTTPPQSCTRSDKMAELARDYHAALQYDESEQDPATKDTHISAVLEAMPPPPVIPEMAELEKDLNEDDI